MTSSGRLLELRVACALRVPRRFAASASSRRSGRCRRRRRPRSGRRRAPRQPSALVLVDQVEHGAAADLVGLLGRLGVGVPRRGCAASRPRRPGWRPSDRSSASADHQRTRWRRCSPLRPRTPSRARRRAPRRRAAGSSARACRSSSGSSRSGKGVSAAGSAGCRRGGAARSGAASRRRCGSLRLPVRSSGRSAKLGIEQAPAASGTPPPCRCAGVAVTRIRCRLGSAARPAASWCRWWRPPRPRRPRRRCAPRRRSRAPGRSRTKSSRRRSDLMKSVETMTYG